MKIDASNSFPENKLDFLALSFSSCFFLSYLPSKLLKPFYSTRLGSRFEASNRTGAGLVGSLFGVLTFLLLPRSLANSLLLILLATLFSVFISARAEKILSEKDDPRIVIDEWIGMWVSMVGLNITGSFWGVLLVFVLFRFFDVVKGPWGHALQRLPGGWGITMDDVLAGILTNLSARLLFTIF